MHASRYAAESPGQPPTLQALVEKLLRADNAAQAKAPLDALLARLAAATGIDLLSPGDKDDVATVTAHGKAISMLEAARCANDIERTRVFLRGIRQAIDDCLCRQPCVDILYAGCGPFGLLLAPLLPAFLAGQVHVTFVDIHARSLACLRDVLAAFAVDKNLYDIQCADATRWSPAAGRQFDIVVSETMKHLLQQEPQVAVFSHLQRFVKTDGILIPQRITLSAWLSNSRLESACSDDVAPGKKPLWLGTIFDLQRDSAGALGQGDSGCLSGELRVPDYDLALTDLKLTTDIQVYGNHRLSGRQSQLTLPLYKYHACLRPHSLMRFRYKQGECPDFQFDYDSMAAASDEPLADSLQAPVLGIYHVLRLWQKAQRERAGTLSVDIRRAEWPLDMIVQDQLGLGLEQCQARLYGSETFEDFAGWIQERHGGVVDADTRERVNGSVQHYLACGIRDVSCDDASANVGDGVPRAAVVSVLSAAQIACWRENGYLVVPGVLSAAQVAASEDAVWQLLGADRQDRASWYRAHPAKQGIMLQCFDHPVLNDNRHIPLIRQIFAQLWQTGALVATADRVSFNPPQTSDWIFPGPHMHWDAELKPPVAFRTQGMIYLTDTAAHQGAFRCVPGFHHRINRWLATLPPGSDPQQQDWDRWDIRSIAANAGDLIVWQQALPHGSAANLADYPRIVQYINMYPLDARG